MNYKFLKIIFLKHNSKYILLNFFIFLHIFYSLNISKKDESLYDVLFYFIKLFSTIKNFKIYLLFINYLSSYVKFY